MKIKFTRISIIVISLGFFVLILRAIFVNFDRIEELVLNTKNSSEKIWKVPVPNMIESFHPKKVGSAFEKGLLSLIYSRLVKVNENQELIPDILSHWSYNTADRKFIFYIREDAVFSNGKSINSEDIIFSFEQWAKKDYFDSNLLIKIEGVEEYRSLKRKSISGVKQIDSKKIELKLLANDENFIYNLSLPRFVVFPYNFLGKSFEQYVMNPIASGPYKLISLNKEIFQLKSNELYFLGDPKIHQLEFIKMDFESAKILFNENKIDNLIFYENTSYKNNTKIQDVHIQNVPTIPSEYLGNYQEIDVDNFDIESIVFNSKANPILQDIEVRKFIVKSINIPEISSTCYKGGKFTSSLIPKEIFHSVQIEDHPQHSSNGIENILLPKKHQNMINLDIKQKLKLNPVTLWLSDEQNFACISEVLSNALKRIHVEVSITQFSELFRLFKENKLGFWIESFVYKNEDPFSILQYFSPESNEYLLGNEYDPLSRLYKKLYNVVTKEEKTIILKEIDTYLISNYLVVPLGTHPNKVILRNNIKDLRFAGSRYHIVDWHSIRIN